MFSYVIHERKELSLTKEHILRKVLSCNFTPRGGNKFVISLFKICNEKRTSSDRFVELNYTWEILTKDKSTYEYKFNLSG